MTATNSGPVRRRFLQLAAGAAAVGWIPKAVRTLSFPQPVFAQSTLTPEAALAELMAGNKRYTVGKMTAHEQDLAILRQSTAKKQEPFAAVLSCADSRVPVELIFDQSIGHIFVTRVAGNIITPEIVASLEYAAMVLGTKVLLVIGHADCGAVKATIRGKEVPGQISALFPHIQPAVDQAGDSLEAATKANAHIQAALLRESSTVVSALVKEGQLKVAAAYYDIVSGSVSLL
jgi:carbonic anhydrase